MEYEDDLYAVCAECVAPVADGDGVLEVDTGAALSAWERWCAQHGDDPHAELPLPGTAESAAWRVRHLGCGRPRI